MGIDSISDISSSGSIIPAFVGEIPPQPKDETQQRQVYDQSKLAGNYLLTRDYFDTTWDDGGWLETTGLDKTFEITPGQCLILGFSIELTYTPNDVLNTVWELYIDHELVMTGVHSTSALVDLTNVFANTVLNSGVTIGYRMIMPNSVNNHNGYQKIRLLGYWLPESRPTT